MDLDEGEVTVEQLDGKVEARLCHSQSQSQGRKVERRKGQEREEEGAGGGRN